MMNMIDIQDKLKGLSEDQLVREMQMPSGNAPQFLVLTEINRRKTMRDSFAAQQAKQGIPTVAEEVVTAAAVPQQGLPAMASAMAPKSSIEQNTGIGSLPVQGMYAGGPVRKMAEGGPASLFSSDGQERRKALQDVDEGIYEAMRYYLGPTGIPDRVNAIADYFAPETPTDLALGVVGGPVAGRLASSSAKGIARSADIDAPSEKLRAVVRPDNSNRGDGVVRTSVDRVTNPYAVRVTGQDQIDDMIKSGLVRPPVGGYSGKPVVYFHQMDDVRPKSIVHTPKDDPRKAYSLVMNSEAAASKEGPIQIDELLHAWTMRDGDMVDVLEEILRKNQKYDGSSGMYAGGPVKKMAEGGIVVKNGRRYIEQADGTLIDEMTGARIYSPAQDITGMFSGFMDAITPGAFSTSDIPADPEAVNAETARVSNMRRRGDAARVPVDLDLTVDQPNDDRTWAQRNIGDPLRGFFQPIGAAATEFGQPIGAAATEFGKPIGEAMTASMRPIGGDIRSLLAGSPMTDASRAEEKSAAGPVIPPSLPPAVLAELEALGVSPEDFAKLPPDAQDSILNFEDIIQPMREREAEVTPMYDPGDPGKTFLAETLTPDRAESLRRSTLERKRYEDEAGITRDTGTPLTGEDAVKAAEEAAQAIEALSGAGTGVTTPAAPVGAPVTSGGVPVASGGVSGGGGGGGGGAAPGGAKSFLEQALERADKRAQQDKWLALAQVGLQLMASKEPTIGGALGEAGAAGLEAYRSARDTYDKERFTIEQAIAAQKAAAAKALRGSGIAAVKPLGTKDLLADLKFLEDPNIPGQARQGFEAEFAQAMDAARGLYGGRYAPTM